MGSDEWGKNARAIASESQWAVWELDKTENGPGTEDALLENAANERRRRKESDTRLVFQWV